MIFLKRLILLLLITVVLSGCSFGKQSEKAHELTIFFDDHPSEEFQRDLHDLMDEYDIGNMKMDMDKPSHIKEFPTFVIVGTKGQFETNNFKELKDYLKQTYY